MRRPEQCKEAMTAIRVVKSELDAWASSTLCADENGEKAFFVGTMNSSLATLQDASLVIAHGTDQRIVADCCHQLR